MSVKSDTETYARVVIVAGLLLAPTCIPAKADWAFTKWGMSLDETIRASNGNAMLIQPSEIRALSTFIGSECRARILSYQISEYSFEVRFCFAAGGGLSSVVLYSKGDHDFYGLDRDLHATYGAPVDQKDGSIPERIWSDREHGNAIRLLSLYPSAVLEYKPTPTGFMSNQNPPPPAPIPQKVITLPQSAPEAPNKGTNAQAILYEERTSTALGSADPGDVHWELLEDESKGPTIRADVSIPSDNIRFSLTIRRNLDRDLPASHVVELIFVTPDDLEGGGVEKIVGMAMKNSEQDAGDRLKGPITQVSDGFFLIAMSDRNAESAANMKLLNRSWVDVPFVFKSGRRALLTLQKGRSGMKIFSRAVQSWRDPL